MMGMIRCNVPSIFIYGGSALPGRFAGETSRCSMPTRRSAASDRRDRRERRSKASSGPACRAIGACAGQFTANTMAMVSEAMGLTMPNVCDGAGRLCRARADRAAAGRLVMQMLERGGPLPREIVTRKCAGERRAPSSPRPAARPTPRCTAGARQRGRHRLHARRCRRGVRAHAADRRSAPGRQISRQGRLRHRRLPP